MNTHVEKSQINKSESVSNADSLKKNDGKTTFQFVDNRPEAIVQRKLQKTINHHHHVNHASQLQAMTGLKKKTTSFQPIQLSGKKKKGTKIKGSSELTEASKVVTEALKIEALPHRPPISITEGQLSGAFGETFPQSGAGGPTRIKINAEAHKGGRNMKIGKMAETIAHEYVIHAKDAEQAYPYKFSRGAKEQHGEMHAPHSRKKWKDAALKISQELSEPHQKEAFVKEWRKDTRTYINASQLHGDITKKDADERRKWVESSAKEMLPEKARKNKRKLKEERQKKAMNIGKKERKKW